MRYAVVGFGTAGYHAVKTIREYDADGEIDVYSNTERAPYNPMLTTYYAFGKLEFDGLFPFGDLETIQKEISFNLRKETVKKVHAQEHTVETENGMETYDRILISTGARAFAPPVKGLEPEDAFLMRTVEDSIRFKERLKKQDVKHAVVIGASMAGIKVVEVLHKFGIETWLLDLAKNIFPLAAYPEVSAEIEKRVEAQGVHLKFGATIDHMEVEDGQKTAVLTEAVFRQILWASALEPVPSRRRCRMRWQSDAASSWTTICGPRFLVFLQRETAVKAITSRADRTRSSACGQTRITRARWRAPTWQDRMWLIKETSFTTSPIS